MRRMRGTRQSKNVPNLLLLIETICSSPTITCTSELDPLKAEGGPPSQSLRSSVKQ